MASPEEQLVDWLRNAYAMEKQAESLLKAQACRPSTIRSCANGSSSI